MTRTTTTVQVARSIQLPFPCGCLDEHSAPNGFKVGEHTCETHRGIAAALTKAIADERERQWQPIETAPKNEEWRVVGKISDGKLLWWYRAMFWRGGWHTARSYDTRVAPGHWFPLPESLDIRRDDTGEKGS